MTRLFARFRPMPRQSLGGLVMSVLGVAMTAILIVFTFSAVYFVFQTETIAWQGRQDEAARNAAGTVAAVVQRAHDTLTMVGLLNADVLALHPEELDSLLQQNSTLEETIRLDAQGHVFAEAHRTRSVLAELITIPQSQWFLIARSGRFYFGPVQMSFDDQPYLLMAVPAPDGGVVAARVRMSVLWGAVADIRFGELGRAYVVTPSGDIIAHTRPDVVLAGTNIQGRPEFAALRAAPQAVWHGNYSNFEGARVVGATAPVPNTDWVVIAELPEAEAFAASRTAVALLGGGLFVLMALTTWAVARLVTRRIVRPMAQLRAGTDRIGQGDLKHRFRFTRPDEIGELARAFDGMAERLEEREARITAQTAALQISEAQYRAIVEDQTELICRYLPDGRLTFVNNAYARYFGQAPEALVGHSYEPLIPIEDQPRVADFVAHLGSTHPLETIEHRVILPNGSMRWQHWTDRVIMDAQGQVVEYQAVGRDITERKQAEAALRASEERLRRITDNMLDIISQINSEGIVEYASPSHRWVLGLEPDTVMGHMIFERLHPDDLTPALMALGQALADKVTSAIVTFRYQHADGRYLWMECIGNILYDAHGQPTGAILCSRDITERQEMEQALRESEQRYRLLAENVSDLIWVSDMSLQMTYVSPSVTKLRGFSVEEALSQPLTEILTPASAAQAQTFFLDILTQAAGAAPRALHSQSRSLDLEMVRKDGSTVWTESQMTFLLDEQGQPTGILGVTRDITERQQAAEALRQLNNELEDRVRERTAQVVQANAELLAEIAERQRIEVALRDSETRLRRITDNMLDLIVQVDGLGVYQYASSSHRVVMGYAAEELVGKPMYEFIHPDDLLQVAEAAQRALIMGATSQLEVRVRHADGHYVWVEAMGNPLRDENGEVIGAIIASRDVTQRRQAEDLVRQAEAKYRMLVENIPAAVFIWELGEQGACRYISPQIEPMLGFSVEEWLSNRGLWSRQLHPDDRTAAIARDVRSLVTGEPLYSEYRLFARDGHVVWVRDEGIVFADETGQRHLNQGYLLDITQQKQAEEQIQASLREKEVLLKEIHHRVKNNLQIISSLLNLQSKAVDDVRVLEMLRDSQNRVKSMALVHEKLYGSVDLSQIDFAEYVRSLAAQLFRTYANTAAAVALRLNVAAVWLNVDTAIPCGLIINELVSNALKHAFPNRQEGEICIDLQEEGGQIVLRVADTGVGFPESVDFRESPSLGLRLVTSLVEQINGVVELRRTPGTEFRIVFKTSSPAIRS